MGELDINHIITEIYLTARTRRATKEKESMRMCNKGPNFDWEVREVFCAELMFDLRSE